MSDRAELLTTAQVAAVHQISVRTVLRMALEGDLPFVMKLPTKTGGYLFNPEAVERALADRAATEQAEQTEVPEQVPA